MRIVIDMQGAQTESRFRGIGRYTISFARAVAANCKEHEVFLALNGLFPDTIEPIRTAFEGVLPQKNIHVWYAPGPVSEKQQGNETRRKTAELMREAFLAALEPDVIHISSLFEGYVDDALTSIGRLDQSTPVSVILYDLIPLLNPGHYLTPRPHYSQYYLRKIEHLKHASALLAISGFTRQEALEHLDFLPVKPVNISTAIDSCFKPLVPDEHTRSCIQDRFGIDLPFVLYTGGADERKNLPRLIKAWAALAPDLRKKHQLVLAGRMSADDTAYLEAVACSEDVKKHELIFTGYVSDEELVQLYNLCRLYIFPSWHEGFGLPALEAMACGAAVIGANTSSLPEVIGLEEALFDPFEVKSISAKMEQVLADESFRKFLQNYGLQQAGNFSWDTTAQRAITAWEELYASGRGKDAGPPGDRKPLLAFVSPMPPARTGIADYSAELIPALCAHYDIEIVVARKSVETPWSEGNIKVRDIGWLRANAHNVERVLYQMGNSAFHKHMLSLVEEIPGTVVLHDFYLSGLLEWLELHGGEHNVWTKALYSTHGYPAVKSRCCDAHSAVQQYPVNGHILQHAQGIIVHSEYSRNMARQWYGNHWGESWKVVPHLRSPRTGVERETARTRLGYSESDFLVCSFGFLDSTKLNHRLLKAWYQSPLARDENCHLIFVGENHGGEFGAELLKAINSGPSPERIHITGFASPERFRDYLAATDIAVQLRTQSRGETSGTVLDCMNYALPVIVNAHGSMAELDRETVLMLPDKFLDEELVEALETLWQQPQKRRRLGEKARGKILHSHSPQACAKQYAEAIETFHSRRAGQLPTLIQAISDADIATPDTAGLVALARALNINHPLPGLHKRIFLDISATVKNDRKTGIERVARAIAFTLLESAPPGYRIEPVYLSCIDGTWHHRYAAKYTLRLLNCPEHILNDDAVDMRNGDILLTLDLIGAPLVQAQKAGLFADYRNRGVWVYATVFDLLPLQMPEVFPPGADRTHQTWLKAIAEFDGAVCISEAVSSDLQDWIDKHHTPGQTRRDFSIHSFHLGADVSASVPTRGLPDGAGHILKKIKARPGFLMVGTVEPRKGYTQVLEAFEHLWLKGIEVNLVIAGREGWKDLPAEMRRDIPAIVQRLRSHTQSGKRLFWLEDVSDEYLEKLYSASISLIAASYGEGFGLPLIEAAQHRLPVIARDIPVFREVAGEHACFFDTRDSAQLAESLLRWMDLYKQNRHPLSVDMPWQTWKKSALQLLDTITAGH